MHIRRISALAVLLAGFAGAASAADLSATPSGVYVGDPGHQYITITYSHLGFSTPTIRFTDFKAELTLDAAAPENSKVSVTIPAASIDSGVDALDAHLKNADFFDVEKFPTITFVSTALKTTGENTGEMTGNLTIKDVTKPVTLAVTLNKAAPHPSRKTPTVGVNATTAIKRSEWGLSRATPHVGDDVTLNISVEFQQAK